MRRQQSQPVQLQREHSDDDCTSSTSQILERVQSDRITVTKPEEDRRRRTIIIEKNNGSYGFTLQSYGIHYKKEQEIEMITYVDYVDYDGPAYRAGMREGDVILSINGSDVEKADHKALVSFIKSCESRMRMVVLFEDCVRKVELHMRYIQLQRILQNKMHELDKLCIRERQLIEGKWKTHSLPARKKTSSHANYGGDPTTPTQAPYSYCRPTVSTEDVAKAQQKQHAPPTLILAYQCLDPRYHYTLQSSKTNSGEYLLTFEQPRYKRDDHHFIAKTPCNAPQKQNKANQTNGSARKNKKNQEGCHSYGGHLCSPCIQASNSADNSSLEAYDLASPCCDPHCVPTVRRRSRNSHNKESKKRDSKTEETQTDSRAPHRERPPPHQSSQTQSAPRRYFQFGAGLVSQCSLHSCTSSELSVIAPTTTGESTGSYTTSLSTDTLYWDGLCDGITKQMSMKSSGKHESQYKHNQQPPQTHHDPIHVQYTTVKPKSWDNLATTKSYGGYGFGYGYIDTSTKYLAGKGRTQSTKTHSNNPQYVRIPNSCSGPTQYTPHAQRGHFHPTKSTESLLSVPKYSIEALSDSSTSCECLETVSPAPDTSDRKFFQSPRQSVVCSTDPNLGYYSTRSSRNEYPKAVVTTSSEATQL